MPCLVEHVWLPLPTLWFARALVAYKTAHPARAHHSLLIAHAMPNWPTAAHSKPTYSPQNAQLAPASLTIRLFTRPAGLAWLTMRLHQPRRP